MTFLRLLAGRACTRAALVIVAQLCGCATSTVVTPSTPNISARPGGCHVQVVGRGGTIPPGDEEIARIESHVQRNFFFGGRVTLLQDAYNELRAKACEAGGDRVRVDDFVESAAAEMTHVHVWATVFRSRGGDVQ